MLGCRGRPKPAIMRAPMQTKTLSLARAVIARASRELPADAALREALRSAKGLTPADSRETAEAVFAYFRWHGWVRDLDSGGGDSQGAWSWLTNFGTLRGPFPMQIFASVPFRTGSRRKWMSRPAWVRSLQSVPRLWLRAKKGRGSIIRETLWDCEPVGIEALSETFCYTGRSRSFSHPRISRRGF